MKIRTLVLAVTLATASFAASAADYAATVVDVGQLTYQNTSPEASFSDWISFDVAPDSEIFVSLSGTSSTSFSVSSFGLYDSTKTLVQAGTFNNASTGTASLGLITGSASAGSYFLFVSGATNGGTYNGNISLSPVPEPETYALMLAGLGLIGFAARRRQS